MKKYLYTTGLVIFIVSLLVFFNQAWADTSLSSCFTCSAIVPFYFDGSNATEIGEAFTSSQSATLTSARFYINVSGSPTGNVVARLFNLTGTYGTNAVPTGSALATSDSISASSISSGVWQSFTFSGVNQYSLVGGNTYGIELYYTGGDTLNKFFLYADNSHPYGGNLFESPLYTVSWDLLFQVFGSTGSSVTAINTSGQKMMMGMPY